MLDKQIPDTPASILRSTVPQDTEEQKATQSIIIDEGTGDVIEGDFLILKDDRGDNHFFKNWPSVIIWAQSKADEK
jgi:hypothetical protein